MKKLKKISINRKEAFIIWKSLPIDSVTQRLWTDLFKIAFPRGTKDKWYRDWIKESN